MAADTALHVSELFHSIQGESFWSGYPCVFIRLHGCNLRCSYCDSRYSYEEEGTLMAQAEILDFCQRHPASMVEITGGEPLLQPAVYPLMDRLLAGDRLVLLETNGTIDLGRVPDRVVKIMDVKCPGAGVSEGPHPANLARLGPEDELKFVLSSRHDYDWAVDFLRHHHILAPAHARQVKVSFSPVSGQLAPQEVAGWLLADQVPARLSLQLHTLLWPDQPRGV